MEFIEACKEFIAIDSTASNGTEEISNLVAKWGEKLGLHVEVIKIVRRGAPQANVVCSLKPITGDVELALQAHLDTVNPGAFGLWNKTGRNPFNATIHEETIFGLGAVKSKLDFICKLFAAQKFVGREANKNFIVCGTFGAEAAMHGSLCLAKDPRLKPRKIMVGEPTELNPVFAGKGIANVEVTIPFTQEEMDGRAHHDTIESQSTHSRIFRGSNSKPKDDKPGLNSIENLLVYLKQLPDQLLILDLDGGSNFNTSPSPGRSRV